MRSENYFVYLYRDTKGIPRYVGKATNLSRSTSHATSAAHNKELHDWIQNGEHTVEVIGPLETETMAVMIESALISCLVGTPTFNQHLFNKIDGASQGAFRPLYVPAALNDRLMEPAISKEELEYKAASEGPLLFVYVDNGRIDNRVGFSGLTLPGFDEIAERVEKYWQLQKRVRQWKQNTTKYPKLLIALAGRRENRIIVASCKIEFDEQGHWQKSDFYQNGLMTVPIQKATEADLDFLSLRGRRISEEACLKFNSFRHQQFKILPDM